MAKNQLLIKKAKGFYFSGATLVSVLLGLLSFFLLTSKGFESAEIPGAVIGCAVATMVLCLVTMWRDLFHVFSLLSFVMATATFFVFLSGRISYLAFYFSGDVMGTGLSPFFVLSAVCFLISLVLSAAAMCFPQEK